MPSKIGNTFIYLRKNTSCSLTESIQVAIIVDENRHSEFLFKEWTEGYSVAE